MKKQNKTGKRNNSKNHDFTDVRVRNCLYRHTTILPNFAYHPRVFPWRWDFHTKKIELKKELNNNNNNNNRIFFQSTQKKKQTHKSLQPVLTDSWRRIDSDSFRNAVDCRRLNSLCHKKKWPFTTTNADQHDNNEQNKNKQKAIKVRRKNEYVANQSSKKKMSVRCSSRASLARQSRHDIVRRCM